MTVGGTCEASDGTLAWLSGAGVELSETGVTELASVTAVIGKLRMTGSDRGSGRFGGTTGSVGATDEAGLSVLAPVAFVGAFVLMGSPPVPVLSVFAFGLGSAATADDDTDPEVPCDCSDEYSEPKLLPPLPATFVLERLLKPPAWAAVDRIGMASMAEITVLAFQTRRG